MSLILKQEQLLKNSRHPNLLLITNHHCNRFKCVCTHTAFPEPLPSACRSHRSQKNKDDTANNLSVLTKAAQGVKEGITAQHLQSNAFSLQKKHSQHTWLLKGTSQKCFSMLKKKSFKPLLR